jgi:hypothetical protein
VKLSDQQRPTSYVMHASGAGAPGQVKATVNIGLQPSGDGETTLTYSADAVVGGPVAGVGQRMMTGVAKRMAGQFFKAIDDELTGAVVPIGAAPSAAAAAGEAAPAGEVAAAGAPAVGRVYTGKAAAAAGARPGADLQSALLGAVAGAVLTLLGVLIGYRLGRRTTR